MESRCHVKTERVFLMELFLDDKLPKCIKEKIKDRFQEMDEPQMVVTRPQIVVPENVLSQQSPSMQRLMQQNPDLIPKPPVPVTPAAAAALAQRQALLNAAGTEKPESGRKSPRKI